MASYPRSTQSRTTAAYRAAFEGYSRYSDCFEMRARAVVAFMLRSVYYAVATPLERRAVGEAALDRGRPKPWKVLAELVRTAIVASAFAWIAVRAGDLDVGHGAVLALIAWVGFPLVLLSGSVIWENVHPVTAAMHAGDWLLKLLLIAVVLGLLH